MQYKGYCGLGSSVGIATGYGLDGPGIKSRWGTRFSAPVQIGPGAHPASCIMGTGTFPGVKSVRTVTLTLMPYQERVELYLCSPYGPYGLYRASVPVHECTLPFFLVLPIGIFFWEVLTIEFGKNQLSVLCL